MIVLYDTAYLGHCISDCRKHTDAETAWPLFHGHFQNHFFVWKLLSCDSNLDKHTIMPPSGVFEYKCVPGRIQGLKLGVAQMDWKFWKKKMCVCVGGWGWVGVGVCVEKRKGDILNILQIYDNHNIYISITIYLKYDFYYKTVYLKPPYIMFFKKILLEKFWGGGGGGGGGGRTGRPPPKSAPGVCTSYHILQDDI